MPGKEHLHAVTRSLLISYLLDRTMLLLSAVAMLDLRHVLALLAQELGRRSSLQSSTT